MLVLSRQVDESIMIGDDIEVEIVDIRGDKARLGITAPAGVPVHRKEVYEAIKRENRNAAAVRVTSHGITGGEVDVVAKSGNAKLAGPKVGITGPTLATE